MHESPQTPKDRRRASTIHRIIEVATEIVMADGLGALSIQRLAATLDYTPGALYRYFPSKEAVVSTVIVGIIDDVGTTLRDLALATVERSGIERVRALALRWSVFAAEAPNRFGLIQMLLATPQVILPEPELAQPAIAAMFQAMGSLREALRDAAHEGTLRAGDPTQRALVLFAALQGALMLRKQAHHLPQVIVADVLYREVLETLLRGWAVRTQLDSDSESEGSLS